MASNKKTPSDRPATGSSGWKNLDPNKPETPPAESTNEEAVRESAEPLPAPPPLRFDIEYEAQSPAVKLAAQRLYESYIANSRGLAWDGRPCPRWPDVNDAVRSHWCAVVLAISNDFEDAEAEELGWVVIKVAEKTNPRNAEVAPAGETYADLSARADRLQRELDRVSAAQGAVEERKISTAVKERTTLLESEVDKLRRRVAELETMVKR